MLIFGGFCLFWELIIQAKAEKWVLNWRAGGVGMGVFLAVAGRRAICRSKRWVEAARLGKVY